MKVDITREEISLLLRNSPVETAGDLNSVIALVQKLREAAEKLDRPITLQVRSDQLVTLSDA